MNKPHPRSGNANLQAARAAAAAAIEQANSDETLIATPHLQFLLDATRALNLGDGDPRRDPGYLGPDRTR